MRIFNKSSLPVTYWIFFGWARLCPLSVSDSELELLRLAGRSSSLEDDPLSSLYTSVVLRRPALARRSASEPSSESEEMAGREAEASRFLRSDSSCRFSRSSAAERRGGQLMTFSRSPTEDGKWKYRMFCFRSQ